MSTTTYQCYLKVMRREILRIATKPMYLFCMVIAPLFCFLFFTTLMENGLPTNLPAGVVDLDNTATTRNIIRNLDAFQQTQIVAHYPSVTEARQAVQRGEIYSFYYIPKGTTEEALASRQPKVSFYVNYSYLIAGSLLYKDQRTMSELASAAVGQATLLAKGATEDQALAFLQPVVISTHALNNPWLNYSVYLCNTLFPGILMLLIFLTTVYTIGTELKEKTSKELMQLADNSIVTALVGKLIPQTVTFFIMATFYNVYLYGFLHYPCHSGIFPMLLAGLLLVLASQAFGVFLFGLLGSLGHGDAPYTAGFVRIVPLAALLPALRESGLKRLSGHLCLACRYRPAAVHAPAFLLPKKNTHGHAALCLYSLTLCVHEKRIVKTNHTTRLCRSLPYMQAGTESRFQRPGRTYFLLACPAGLPAGICLYLYQ